MDDLANSLLSASLPLHVTFKWPRNKGMSSSSNTNAKAKTIRRKKVTAPNARCKNHARCKRLALAGNYGFCDKCRSILEAKASISVSGNTSTAAVGSAKVVQPDAAVLHVRKSSVVLRDPSHDRVSSSQHRMQFSVAGDDIDDDDLDVATLRMVIGRSESSTGT